MAVVAVVAVVAVESSTRVVPNVGPRGNVGTRQRD